MPGISAVSPPISAQPASRQPSAIDSTTAPRPRVELPGRVIIEEEQGFGALDDQVVGAHRDQVDSDPAVTAGLDRQLELGPDPVVRGDEQGVANSRGLQVEEAAEPAKLGVRAGPRGRSRHRADRFTSALPASIDTPASA